MLPLLVDRTSKGEIVRYSPESYVLTYLSYFIHLPMKMELIEGSETSATSIVTPGNYPKENMLHTYLLTYLLTPWSRVLLEKPTAVQLVKKFPALYGIRNFINVFTSARHLSLS